MALAFELPVFIDTNLNTHIAMSVSPNTAVGDLKRKLRREHFICFSNLGQIRVHALMVKRKSCFYHLPDTMPIKNAFQGLKGTWFLRMDATRTEEGKACDEPCLSWLEADAPISKDTSKERSKCLVDQVSNSISNLSNFSDCRRQEEHITFTDKNNLKSKTSKRWRDQSACVEDLLKGLVIPVCNSNKRRKRRLKKECDSEYHVNRSIQNTKIGACVSTKNAQTRGVINACETLDIDVNDGTILLKHSFGSSQCRLEDIHQGKLEFKVSHMLLQDNPCDGKNGGHGSHGGKFKKRIKSCKDMRSKSNSVCMGMREGKIETLGDHHHNGQENYNTSINKEFHTYEEIGSLGATQQGLGVSLQGQDGHFHPEREVVCREERARWSVDDPTSVSSSEIISVTGIITRYFSEADEVNTVDSHKNKNRSGYDELTPCNIVASYVNQSKNTKKCSENKISDSAGTGQTSCKKQRNTISCEGDEDQSCKAKYYGYCSGILDNDKPQHAVRASPSMFPLPFSVNSNTETPKSKPGRTEVGKRFLLAANDLGISTSKRPPLSSICTSKGGKLSLLDSTSLVRNIVFEISGSE